MTSFGDCSPTGPTPSPPTTFLHPSPAVLPYDTDIISVAVGLNNAILRGTGPAGGSAAAREVVNVAGDAQS